MRKLKLYTVTVFKDRKAVGSLTPDKAITLDKARARVDAFNLLALVKDSDVRAQAVFVAAVPDFRESDPTDVDALTN